MTNPIDEVICNHCWQNKLKAIDFLTPTIVLAVDEDSVYHLVDSNGHSESVLYTFPFTPTVTPFSSRDEERLDFLNMVAKEETLLISQELRAEQAELNKKLDEGLERDERVLSIEKDLESINKDMLSAWLFVENLRKAGWKREKHGAPAFWIFEQAGQIIETATKIDTTLW